MGHMLTRLNLTTRHKVVSWKFKNPKKLKVTKIVAHLAVKDAKYWKLVCSDLTVELENNKVNELDIQFSPEELNLQLSLPKIKVPNSIVMNKQVQNLETCIKSM